MADKGQGHFGSQKAAGMASAGSSLLPGSPDLPLPAEARPVQLYPEVLGCALTQAPVQ